MTRLKAILEHDNGGSITIHNGEAAKPLGWHVDRQCPDRVRERQPVPQAALA